MYQRSSQEPRYKQSTRAREPRHVESNEYSEVCSSEEEEEEESTDRCTEETEEDSAFSLESGSTQESEKTHVLDQRNSAIKYTSCDKFCINPCLSATKAPKKDQFTQKNLLSPFPSYWAPPIQKEVSGGTYCRVSNIMPITKEQCQYQTSERTPMHSPKKKESEKEGYTKRSVNEADKKWEKHKSGKDGRLPKADQTEETMRRDHRDSSGKFITPLKENISTNFGGTSSRRPRTSSRDIECCNQIVKNCPDCVPIIEARAKSKRKSTAGAGYSEKELRSKDVILSKDIGDGKLVKGKGREVKEKLVYVVEEDGKDPTKIETDIFSLNEILAIKKDLLELSEFAKKLKKLKEMKKDSECDQNKNNSCQCHPAEELLRDVNKRIEALEARQEELERKSRSSKNSPKGGPKTPTKKLVKPKTLSLSPPKAPIVANLSAATTVPSDPKTEILVTRAEGFACNSDIVNELMDIKTQLEKLEKKRMLKDFSKENIALKEPAKFTKTKEHAIAVFSSKTYILTTDNFDKTKRVGEKSKKELNKDNVVKWLKNVSMDRPENEVSVFLSADAKREENFLEPQKAEEHKCQNRVQLPIQEDLENQEPQKNRALGNIEKGVDMSITYFVKNQAIEESNQFGEQKKCIVTSSGNFIAMVSKSSINIEKNPSKKENPETPPDASPERASPKIVHRSASNGSIPSTILIKRQLKKLKSQLTRKKHRNEMRVIRSKSATTIVTKPEKQSHSRKVKNSEKAETSGLPTEKKHKEGKTEFFKRLEAQFLTLARSLGMIESSTTSYSYSELLATVDLETEPKKWPENPNGNQIIMYSETKKKSNKKPKPRKKLSCEQECKELRKRRRLDEKCKKLKQKLDHKYHKDLVPKPKSKQKPPKPKKPKVRHYHHHRCRSCLLVHPWHPPCKKKNVKEPPPLTEFQVPESYSSEEKNYSSNTNTEYSSSQVTQKSLSCHEEPIQPQFCPEPVHSPVVPVERCLKPKRRSGLINTNLNLDQGLLKKFFKNIGRCYPRSSDKEVCINEKCCVRRIKKCSDHGSRRSESGERCIPTDGSGNCRSSQPPSHSTPLHAPPQQQHLSPYQPPCRPPPPISPPGPPSPQPVASQSPQLTNRRASCHLRRNPNHVILHHSPGNQSNEPNHRFQMRHPHQHNPQHHARHRHSRSPHTSHQHGHRSRSHSHHHHRAAAPQRVARCEYESVGPFLENRNVSTLSSVKDFEPLDDGNNSKTSLRNKKTKKSNKTEHSLSKFNPQVYLPHRLKEDESTNLLFDPLGRKTLLCVCNKCGNVHRHAEKRFNHRTIDQKAVDRKLKRLDKYDPLLEQALAARLEDDFRREYEHYDDSNLGSRSSLYDSNDLASLSDHSPSHKHPGLGYTSAPSDSRSKSYASAPSNTSAVTPHVVPPSMPASSQLPPPASHSPTLSNPPRATTNTPPNPPAPSAAPTKTSRPAPSTAFTTTTKPAPTTVFTTTTKPAPSTAPKASSEPAPKTSTNSTPYTAPDGGSNNNNYDTRSSDSYHYDDRVHGQNCDQSSNYSYNGTCGPCVKHRMCILNGYCSDHYSDKQCGLCKNHPVGLHTRYKRKCSKSPKPKEIRKERETFPFLSFFSQLLKLKLRKPPPKANGERSQTGDGCQCSNKFDVLETRLNEIERELGRPYDGQHPMESGASPRPPPSSGPPMHSSPPATITAPPSSAAQPTHGPEPAYEPEARSGLSPTSSVTPADDHTSVAEQKRKRKVGKPKGKKVHSQKQKAKHEAHKPKTKKHKSPKHKAPKEKHKSSKHREPKEKHKSARHKTAAEEEELPKRKTADKHRRASKHRRKPDRHSNRLDREEKKLHKKSRAKAEPYKKRDELERRKRIEDLDRLNDREAGSYYFTVHTPKLPQTRVLNLPQMEGSKIVFPLQRKLKDGFSLLQSMWTNFRNGKLNSGVENIVNKMKSNPDSDSEELINDCNRSSKKPWTREVFEMKEQPNSLLRKQNKIKSDRRIKRERPSRMKSGRGGYR